MYLSKVEEFVIDGYRCDAEIITPSSRLMILSRILEICRESLKYLPAFEESLHERIINQRKVSDREIFERSTREEVVLNNADINLRVKCAEIIEISSSIEDKVKMFKKLLLTLKGDWLLWTFYYTEEIVERDHIEGGKGKTVHQEGQKCILNSLARQDLLNIVASHVKFLRIADTLRKMMRDGRRKYDMIANDIIGEPETKVSNICERLCL